ncbi:putative Cytochrome P450, family 93, subfamily D, polypeptide 1 [Hibiscus syriacus]|uniref:Cytochrome P450, family 93, subfamily D, polypeptide 1 n=1 Tax=Hibiscus syriacus TaxID=106335 RepID=A0A6A2XDM1_HIBSY|nr:putative Cytochrome P450, family 93, subfamily D, polypeptide 1 [Hibiscus syriacus]
MVDSQFFSFAFLIWSVPIIFLRVILGKRRGMLPPSPRALPVIGHRHLLGPIPHQALNKLSNRYGPLPKLSNLDYLTYGTSDMAMAPYGPYWKYTRKLCMTELLGSRTLDRLLSIRRDEMNIFVRLIREKAETGEAVDIGAELMKLTNNVISRMLLGKRCSGIKKMRPNLDLQGYRKRLKNVRDKFDILMESVISEHKEARNESESAGNSDKVKDVLDLLIDISEDENAEMRLTRENIKAFVMNIFGAGADSSAVTIGWGLSELINHPDVIVKAQEEIDSSVGRNRMLEESDIANLPYLQAIVKETLRLHPSGPLVVRESTEDCTIGGYDIPKQTRLFVNLWALGRDSEHWENPLEFIPERFHSEEWKQQGKFQFLDLRGQHFNLLSFGSGRRSCPGASLALLLIPTVLGRLIQCFDWKVGDGENEDCGVSMEEKAGITLLIILWFVAQWQGFHILRFE